MTAPRRTAQQRKKIPGRKREEERVWRLLEAASDAMVIVNSKGEIILHKPDADILLTMQ